MPYVLLVFFSDLWTEQEIYLNTWCLFIYTPICIQGVSGKWCQIEVGLGVKGRRMKQYILQHIYAFGMALIETSFFDSILFPARPVL